MMGGWMDGWMDGLVCGWLNGWMDGLIDWLSEWVSEWVSVWVSEWVSELVNECTNELFEYLFYSLKSLAISISCLTTGLMLVFYCLYTVRIFLFSVANCLKVLSGSWCLTGVPPDGPAGLLPTDNIFKLVLGNILRLQKLFKYSTCCPYVRII